MSASDLIHPDNDEEAVERAVKHLYLAVADLKLAELLTTDPSFSVKYEIDKLIDIANNLKPEGELDLNGSGGKVIPFRKRG